MQKKQGKYIELTVLGYSVRFQSLDDDYKSSWKDLEFSSELSITKVLIFFLVTLNFTDASTQLFFNHFDFSYVLVIVKSRKNPTFLFIISWGTGILSL